MKKIIAAIAVCGMLVAGQALAADKLIVQDSTGTNTVFKVDDTGTVGVASMLGVGTTSPASTLSVVDQVASGSRGLAVGEYSTDTSGAIVIFRKSRNTFAAPQPVVQGDYVGAFHGQGWDGSAWQTSATVNYYVDGPVSSGFVPMAMLLSTGSNASGGVGNKVARMFIGSDGKISIGKTTNPAVISGTGLVDMAADTMRLETPRTVSPSTTACNQGEISWDTNYVYVCVATNTWKRATLAAY